MVFNYKQDTNTGGNNNNNQNTPNIYQARVRKAMLEGETLPEIFNSLGEYQSIGGVFYTSINNPNPSP